MFSKHFFVLGCLFSFSILSAKNFEIKNFETSITSDNILISWEADELEAQEYWIFGSDVLKEKILKDDPDVFLMAQTTGSSYAISHSFPYYYVTAALTAEEAAKRAEGAQDYPYNPHVPLELWASLKPYFLPISHPVKAKLDRLFSKRITLSKQTFEAAGFAKIHERKPTNIVIGRHPKLSGYLLKVYLDSQPPLWEWMNWVSRIDGANAIRAYVQKYGYKDFTAPRKWIYPLPAEPSPPLIDASSRKNFILVVEDMDILSDEDNRRAYARKMTPQLLDQLYVILTELQLIDSIFIDNAPFTWSGKIAFIDTEHHHAGWVNLARMKGAFSPEMQRHWQKLIDQGGPKP